MVVYNKTTKKKTKATKTRSKLAKIEALAAELHAEQFNEDTPPADQGDILELICMIVQELKHLKGK